VGATIATPDGEIRFEATPGRSEALQLPADVEVMWLSAEQSNSSLILGDKVMLKIFRRVSGGEHPEAEMGKHLTNQGFANVPPQLGEVVRVAADGMRHSLAVAQGFIRNQGDAWSWTLNHLERALDDLGARATNTQGDGTAQAHSDNIADYAAIAAVIGRRLGEMHQILARPSDNPDFAPVAASEKDTDAWAQRASLLVEEALDVLDHQQTWPQDRDRERATTLVRQKAALTSAIRELARHGVGARMTRIHGDFHLGQVLIASGDAYLIDFEGEPSRPLAERRAKASPLRDAAGLLRSFDYAAAALINRKALGATLVSDAQRDAMLLEFCQDASTAFLGAYWQTTGSSVDKSETALLDLFLIEKAAYEVLYEAANRPAWLSVPLGGLAALATRVLADTKVHSHE
jgi:maltose alpha-D-glucosyltransferase / alpha-amylase